MEEKREPDVIEQSEPDKPEPDPEPTPEQCATARPVEGLIVPPLQSTLLRAAGFRTIT